MDLEVSKQINKLHYKREKVFLVLCAFFLCAMTLLNVVGITKFIQIGPLAVAVGVLPYPLTFLCTDLVSELYGRKRANFLVWLGFLLNLFILFLLWLGDNLPSVPDMAKPPWQVLQLAQPVSLPDGSQMRESGELFHLIYACTSGAVFASMVAYLAAQFCDVYLFHFWKRVTGGKKLWLRNNMSTLVSQFIDSFTVISITFGAVYFAGEMSGDQMLTLMGSNYLFKMSAALLDTAPFYFLTIYLRKYLQLAENEEVGWL